MVGCRLLLQIVPVFDGKPVFKSKYLKTNLWARKVISHVRENVITVAKAPNHFNPRLSLCQPCKECRQTLAAFKGLRIVLNIFGLVHNQDRLRITGFNTL